jgi:surface antigen
VAILGLLAGVLAVLAPAVPLASAPAASASSAYLCMGYTRCADAGYSHAGYASRNDRMYWRMYSGHNCTNYVAYRMIQAGMSTERPWSGSGNAYNWGLQMRSITDQRPAVGAVAWWNRNVPGAGSVGHVAYVERVVSPTVIIVSQDSWGGDFSWKRIDKNHSGWPSGFIHFRDKNLLTNVDLPRVSGTPRVGVRIRASGASWKPQPQKVLYQWLADGRPIAGATTANFTPTPREFGKRLTFRIAASRDGSPPVTVTSAATPAVEPGTLTSTELPEITGEMVVGETLSVSRGLYAQPKVTRTRAWYADGVAIPNATERTLTLTRGTIGKTITVRERAIARGYTPNELTADVETPVVWGTIEMVRPVAGSGDLALGSTLTADPGRSRPNDGTVAYQWLRDGRFVRGATQPTYTLTAADVGRTMTVRVLRNRLNFTPIATDYAFTGPVTTTSSMNVETAGGRHVANVRIRVHAPGIDAPDGSVRVRVGKTIVTRALRDGFVRIWFADLAAGRRYVQVFYRGTDVIGRSFWSGRVWVKR